MARKTINTRRPRWWMGLLSGVVLLVTLLASCALNFPNVTQQTDSIIDEEDLITPTANVQFILTVQAVLSEGERIVLEILDEVTGLPYNTRQFDLTQLSDLQYAVSLPFQMGSVLKYHYVKISTELIPEATQMGGEVRYRLLWVDETMTVTDTLQFWQGDPRNIDSGYLAGQILSAEGGAPIPDILVSADGLLTFTDANGHFYLEGVAAGVHNIVFYAIDGAYQTFQQGATVAAGLGTPINISLQPREAVKITLNVTPPNEALGIPIYLAGNLAQLGNTFTDLSGGMSIDPKRMPMLVQQEDGTFTITLSLYSGTDLRYKFTLGDGYWNAERSSANGSWQVRQLIVPDHDITLDLTIDSWRTTDAEPITFEVSIPLEASTSDEKFIQLKTREWTSPLPLWPLGNGNFLYILFSPLDRTVPISYRFCRNEDCTGALNAEAASTEVTLLPTETAQTVQITLTNWVNWMPASEPTEVIAANIPIKESSYLTQIELSPEMDPSWLVYAPIGISTLAEIGANSVQFTPQWFMDERDASITPEIGQTPFMYELQDLIASSRGAGLSASLFPQLGPTENLALYWSPQEQSEAWWESWFNSYRIFILNYAKTAANTGCEQLVLGGKAVLPAFSGGFFLDGTPTNVPETIDAEWITLINDIRSIYPGQLVWATNAQVSVDPLPVFIDQFDSLYISVDAPLTDNDQPTSEVIGSNFWEVINQQLFPSYEQTSMPIILALGYPSVTTATEGCLLIDEACSNDGLFLPSEVSQSAIDLNLQVEIYNSLLPIIANQDWISGISIRGYNPVVSLLDGSSSIAGKPAKDVIWYWFDGLHSGK